ncbi:MAG: hypothetical protein ACI4XJ_01915 [Eubacteriales bacterium]
MKQVSKKVTAIKLTLCAVLTLSLVVMTFYIVYMLNLTQGQVSFDLESITADKSGYNIDIARYLLPEFIGITSDGEKSGISGSFNIMSELYREFSGVISEVMRDENRLDENTLGWNELEKYESSVYIRYHSVLPDCVIGIFADSYAAGDESFDSDTSGEYAGRGEVYSYVYEMYIIPNTDGSGKIIIAVRDRNGDTAIYSADSESIFTGESVEKMREAYLSSMYSYKMFGGEPVFVENVVARNVIITGNTAQSNTESDVIELMRLFALNPDKLLSSHENEEGNSSYIDTHGILSVTSSAFEYTSSSDGGIGIDDFIGHSDAGALEKYIKASISIINFIRSLNKNYAGGDAEIYFDSVSSSGGKVTLSFRYAFDGIVIEDIEPAFTAVFENGILRSARLYTISVRNLGDRQELMSEKMFIDIISSGGAKIKNTSLVYRGDFVSESVKAEWRGETWGE